MGGVPGPADLGAGELLLVGGAGDFSTLDEHPWILAFFDFLSNVVIPEKIPTFASCFGFQSIVRAGGAAIVKDPSRAEVGTFRIDVTKEGAHDSLFGQVAAGFPAQPGHNDHPTAPPSARSTEERRVGKAASYRVPPRP